jgi:hypothetical protein
VTPLGFFLKRPVAIFVSTHAKFSFHEIITARATAVENRTIEYLFGGFNITVQFIARKL